MLGPNCSGAAVAPTGTSVTTGLSVAPPSGIWDYVIYGDTDSITGTNAGATFTVSNWQTTFIATSCPPHLPSGFAAGIVTSGGTVCPL